MKTTLALVAILAGFAAPAIAQDAASMTCEAFNALDDASRAALAPQIKTLESVSTTEPYKNQDGAELITSVTEACSAFPTSSLNEAISEVANTQKQKG